MLFTFSPLSHTPLIYFHVEQGAFLETFLGSHRPDLIIPWLCLLCSPKCAGFPRGVARYDHGSLCTRRIPRETVSLWRGGACLLYLSCHIPDETFIGTAFGFRDVLEK